MQAVLLSCAGPRLAKRVNENIAPGPSCSPALTQVLDVARDICKIFNLPEAKIVHVRDRAFNDRRCEWRGGRGPGSAAAVLCGEQAGEPGCGVAVQQCLCSGVQHKAQPEASPRPASARPPADYICDSKLNQLGWRERTSWEDGLRKTVDWYLQNG